MHWQIRIARGERLDIDPERALTPHGHAIECRIYAEDPDLGFMPSPGLIRGLRPASGPGIRDDGGVQRRLHGAGVLRLDDREAGRVGRRSRDEAIARMARALARIPGPRHPDDDPVLPVADAASPTTIAGRYDTTYLDRLLDVAARRERSASSTRADEELIAIAAALDACFGPRVARRRAPAACRGAAAVWKQRRAAARRCADDVRDRDQRPHAARVSRSSAPAAATLPRHASTASVTLVDARAGRRRSALSLLFDGGGTQPRGRRSRRAARRRAARSTSAAGPSPVTVNGRRTGRGAADTRRPARTASRRSSRRCPAASSACSSPPATRSQPRQPVVVVEAMKMENELRSPKAGRVKDVAVTPGASVEAGRVLLVIE